MSAAQAALTRKWVPMIGGSCDIRMGVNAVERATKVFEGAVGRIRACMVVHDEKIDDGLKEQLRRSLVDAGFSVAWHQASSASVTTLAEAHRLFESLADAGITGDDLCCVVGDADLISVVSYVCGDWCGGVALVAIPTDEIALLEGALKPRALSVGSRPRMLVARPCARHVIVDYDLAVSELASEASRYARVLMVGAAMAGSEREFSALWDRAGDLVASDAEGWPNEWVTQLLATAKQRGQITASSAAAVRQSIEYGQTFANAVASLADGQLERSLLVAEGMRFCARLSVLLEKLSVDDMLAQDELLEMLGVGEVACSISPRSLVDALKQERFAHTNRFMLAVPLAIGRVRLTTIEDNILEELAAAWCDAHKAR